MKFATIRQIMALTGLWCVALFVLDYYKNPHLWRAPSARPVTAGEGAYLGLRMNHLCCTGCLADVRAAVAQVPGLGVPAVAGREIITPSQADTAGASIDEYGNVVQLPVTDLQKLDFVAVENVLREKGFSAARMEFGGVPHFRLEADVDHLCCGMCSKATHEGIAFLRARGLGGQFKWLDSVDVDKIQKKIVVYARYLEPGKTVDVGEVISGLNYVGYAPRSVRVLVGERRAALSAGPPSLLVAALPKVPPPPPAARQWATEDAQ